MLAAGISIALFTVLTILIVWTGYRSYVRPGKVYDQLSGDDTVGRVVSATGRREGTAVRVIRQIGKAIPASPEGASAARRDLFAAGYRSESHLAAYRGLTLVSVLLFGSLGVLALRYFELQLIPSLILVGLLAFGGYQIPMLVLEWLTKRRRLEFFYALPDVLDLLVVCVDAGLGIDQAIHTVSRELKETHPDICEELELVNLEIQAGTRRADALHHFAERTRVTEVRKLVAILVQTDKFGTSVADSLRTHSDFMRIRRRQIAEEKANKLGVKLVFPIFIFILPAMLIVVGGAGVLQVFKELYPMMREMNQLN